MWDLLISVSWAIADSDDVRPWSEKLNQVLDAHHNLLTQAALENLAHEVNEAVTKGHFVESLKRSFSISGYRTFLLRSVGSATFHRLGAALKQDIQIIARVARELAQRVMPYAVAMQDTISAAERRGHDALPTARLLQSFTALEAALAEIATGNAGVEALQAVVSPTRTISAHDLALLHQQIRDDVFAKSLEVADRLGSLPLRKLRGARDVLAFSADGVSQAATSLVELIDRLLRNSFQEAEVLEWIRENYPNRRDFVHANAGRRIPTKRAQALCFVAAGQPIGQDIEPLVHLLADALVTVRAELQALKHADTGADEEFERIASAASATHGFLLLVVGFLWRQHPTHTVEIRVERLRVLEANYSGS